MTMLRMWYIAVVIRAVRHHAAKTCR